MRWPDHARRFWRGRAASSENWKRPAASVVLAAALLAAAACSRPQARRFPIGLYGVDDPKDLKEIAASGFDSVFTGRPGALASEAGRRGLRLLTPGPADDPGARGWPLEAWYLYDEPDVHGLAPAELEEASRRAREKDPRPRAFVLGQGAAAERFGAAGDVVMVDWYPVPHLPLDSVADQLDRARGSIPHGKPLWMVLQAMDWRDYPQRDPARPRVGRFPDFSELRFMSYLSVLHGADGLWYFTFRKPEGKTLLDYPEQWQALARVAREMKALQPMLEGARRAPLPYPPDIDSPEAAAWRWRGRDYVILLNRKADVMQRLPDALLKPEWRPLFEVRRDPRELLERGGDVFYLQPHRVLVLESGLRLGPAPVRTW